MTRLFTALVWLFLLTSSKEYDRIDLSNKDGQDNMFKFSTKQDNRSTCPTQNSSQQGTPRLYNSPEWWLCLLSAATLFFIGWQASEARKAAAATAIQAKISRTSLILEFRPKIKLRRVTFVKGGLNGHRIVFRVHNVGGSKATVHGGEIAGATEYQIGTLNPIEPSTYQGFILEPGERHEIVIPLRVSAFLGISQSFEEKTGTPVFLIYGGEISYSDDNGITRTTAFQRKYNSLSKNFSLDGTEESEYSD